jgi:hypothetical protein
MRCRAEKARIAGRETWLCVDMQGAPVRILVRTDIDWRRMERTDFLGQSDPTRPLAFISSEPLDLWERAFDVDFFSYRAQLQDLAFATFREAGADSMTVGFSDFESWWASTDEEIIVPIDDDDLLVGPLSFLTCEFTDDVDVALWPRATIVVEEDGSMGWRCPETRCMFATNCALRKSFLRRHFGRDEAVKILADHAVANDRIGEVLGVPPDDTALPGFRRLRHPRVAFLPRSFSLKNAHVGSIQVLVQTLRRDDPIGFLRGLTLEVQRPIPDYAAPLMEQVDALEKVWASLRTGRE